MKNDIRRFFETFLSNESNEIHLYGNPDGIGDMKKYLQGVVPHEHPDGYSIIDNEVLIIEQFEFDSSKNKKKKGSSQRRLEVSQNRKFEALPYSKNGEVFREDTPMDYSVESYKNNLTSVFLGHYRKIPEYKNELCQNGIITQNQRVKVLFLIEDVTELGNFYATNSSKEPWMPLILPMCDFFLNLFEQSPEVDYVLCGSWFQNEYSVWYIDHNLIESYRKHVVDTSKITLCSNSLNQLGFKLEL